MQIKLYKCYSVTIDTFSLLTKVVSCPFALADVYERMNITQLPIVFHSLN